MMRHVRAKARGKWQENTAGQTNTQTLTLSVTSELCGCKKAALYGLLSLRANLSDSRYRAFSLVKHRVTTTESLLVIAVTTQRGSCGRADASYFPDKSAFLGIVPLWVMRSCLESHISRANALYLSRNLDASALAAVVGRLLKDALKGGARAYRSIGGACGLVPQVRSAHWGSVISNDS